MKGILTKAIVDQNAYIQFYDFIIIHNCVRVRTFVENITLRPFQVTIKELETLARLGWVFIFCFIEVPKQEKVSFNLIHVYPAFWDNCMIDQINLFE